MLNMKILSYCVCFCTELGKYAFMNASPTAWNTSTVIRCFQCQRNAPTNSDNTHHRYIHVKNPHSETPIQYNMIKQPIHSINNKPMARISVKENVQCRVGLQSLQWLTNCYLFNSLMASGKTSSACAERIL